MRNDRGNTRYSSFSRNVMYQKWNCEFLLRQSLTSSRVSVFLYSSVEADGDQQAQCSCFHLLARRVRLTFEPLRKKFKTPGDAMLTYTKAHVDLISSSQSPRTKRAAISI